VFLGRTKNGEDRTLPLNDDLFTVMRERATGRADTCPYAFHRDGERIQSFGKAWQTACKEAGCAGRLFHDLRRTAVRNLIRAGVPQSVAMKIGGHKDSRIFVRYNIVDTCDVGEAMRKLVKFEQEKQFARAQKVLDVHSSLTEPQIDAQMPALPEKVQ
jgi:integrase